MLSICIIVQLVLCIFEVKVCDSKQTHSKAYPAYYIFQSSKCGQMFVAYHCVADWAVPTMPLVVRAYYDEESFSCPILVRWACCQQNNLCSRIFLLVLQHSGSNGTKAHSITIFAKQCLLHLHHILATTLQA